MPKSKIDNSGFSLLEILVTITILGIVLGTIMSLFSGSMKSIRISQEYSQAVLLARNGMEETLLMEPIEAGEDEGAYDEVFSWERSIILLDDSDEEDDEDIDIEPLPFQLYEIEIKVKWPSGLKEKSTALITTVIVKEDMFE